MKNGFTLLELLVVLVLISLVSAFVAPRITAPIGNLQLKTTTKKIAGALRYSRNLAVSEKEARVCVFDFEHQKMMVFPGSIFLDADVDEVLANANPEISYNMPEGVMIKNALFGEDEVVGGLFSVIFFANGSTTGGEIFFSNNKDKTTGMRVDLITGMVEIIQPEKS